jgi:GNAT superfamily N-acetyltransferase
MTASDVTTVAELCGQLGYPATVDGIVQRFTHLAGRQDDAVLVADADRQVVGWVHVAVRASLETDLTAEIAGLVVDEGWRSRGVGAMLLTAAERWARGAGCEKIRVRSRIARERAHAFYERAGYARIKTQHAFEKPLS